MKILVVIITRNHPAGLISLIHNLHELSSDEHEIKYLIRKDRDDSQSKEVLWFLPNPLRSRIYIHTGDRPLSIGQAINEAIWAIRSVEWDVVTSLMDDSIPITRNWDKGIYALMTDRGFHACAWLEANSPANIHPILSREYFRAQGDRIFPEWFPFWFADTWFAEVYELAYGQPLSLVLDMKIEGRIGTTPRMRELPFWVDFWIKTRKIRIEEGMKVREALGLPEVSIVPTLTKMHRLDRTWPALIPQIEAQRQTHADLPPDDYYLAAKAKAEEWLRSNPDERGLAA